MNPDDRVIKPTEATDYPIWYIMSGRFHSTYHAGPWFSREAAERHLQGARHRYPKSAVVYCHSGHMSADYRLLCETGRVIP